MDDKEQRVITFKLSLEETKALDAKANQAGMSRSDYLRMVLSTPPPPTTAYLEGLIKHCIYLTNQTHSALYLIAEAEGKANRFLSTDELREVYDRSRPATVQYAVEFPERLVKFQAEVVQAAKAS